MNYKNINNLIIFRNDLKLSQCEVAKAMNVSQVTVSYWEKGVVFPSIPSIYKLAKILKVSPVEIFNCFKINDKEF